ncbi:type I restriction enzyme HsdR N-terminal domain-containing protein [Lutimonas saemankumensis]|uniref:type I restriction enzyme HsdR N-terminal domain-containing protein n=1 Tax=Lutimonas saemankumensis TaxID=483016 RepID=UPI001CD29CBB|nr:type I restriction enzyme HsdR N-terminal domain-containing protein [Lutimonas saemankumensis]MCA0931962.1 type I restriction enzyme HsdR N-terminal domain-containing protein [Lutimonas saemankumensis]
MINLNLPKYSFRIKSKENKLYIFDKVRKKDLVLTEEEWVRQHFITYLNEDKKYPLSRMAVEKKCVVNNMAKRTDIVVFDGMGSPYIIVECKAPKVQITQQSFDQIARYNMTLNAKFLIVTNGLQHFYCQMDHEAEEYRFLKEIPDYA